jgi:hypothetical protein
MFKKVFCAMIVTGLFLQSSVVLAQEPIPSYTKIDKSMKALEGALKNSLENCSVSLGYVPNIGAIFICEMHFESDISDVLEETVIELIEALGPLMKIKDEEKIIVILRSSGGFLGERQEYVVVTSKNQLSDTEKSTEKWKIYSSKVIER